MSATEQNELLRGGQFLVKETACEDVFTLEDLSEEQKMMRDSTKEFVDKELWAHWERFEKKDYAFTEETMRKAGEMGLLGVAVPEQYGGLGMGFVSTMLVCDYISGATGSFSTAFGAHTGIGTMPLRCMVLKRKNKNTCLDWLLENGLVPTALQNQAQDQTQTLVKPKQCCLRMEATTLYQDKKCGFPMRASVICLLFLLV